MALVAGSKLGPYEIISPLGAGGMGEVYRARDTRLGRDVAIKVLPHHLSSDLQLQARLEREARTISSLNHPHICHLYDVGRHEGIDYLVMEYLEGETLQDRLNKGPVKPGQAIEYGVQICDALDRAHRQGIVHRDLKPGNIMLTKAGVRLMDFGLAKVAHEAGVAKLGSVELTAESSKLTAEGAIVGTLQYMAPEQLEAQVIDARTDIFAFGTVLYEMITGQPAFNAKSKASLIAAILSSEPTPISSLLPLAPPALDRVVATCLAKNPDDRFQTAHDLKLQLQWIGEASSYSSSQPTRTGTHVAKRVFTTVALLAGTAFLAVWALRTPQLPAVVNTTQVTDDGMPKSEIYSIGPVPAPILTDGLRLYFSEMLGGRESLVQVSVRGGQTVPFGVPFPNVMGADISVNGSEVLVLPFISAEPQEPLWSLPLPAGPPYRIDSLIAQDAAWAADGRGIVYSTLHDIFECKADGSGCQKLVTAPGLPVWMRWSPDGRVLRFTCYDSKTLSTSLWEVSADGNNLHPLLPDWRNVSACCGNWTLDGRYFVFQAAQNERTDIWVMRNSSGWLRKVTITPLTAGPLSSSRAVPSRDGTKVYVLGVRSRGELVRYDQKTQQFEPFLNGDSIDPPAFSKDGKQIAYTAYPQGTLWRANADGSNRLQLTFPPMRGLVPRWSPDGKKLLFAALIPASPARVFTIAASGGIPEPLTSPDTNAAYPDWSPTGDAIVYGGLEGYLTPDIAHAVVRILDLNTHQTSVVAGSEGLICPRWSPDGRYLVAASAVHDRTMLFDFRSKQWQQLTAAPTSCANWSQDGQYVYLTMINVEKPAIVRVRIGDRKLEYVANLSGVRGAPEWLAGPFWWSTLTPDNSPMLLRDRGSQEIYSLDLRLP